MLFALYCLEDSSTAESAVRLFQRSDPGVGRIVGPGTEPPLFSRQSPKIVELVPRPGDHGVIPARDHNSVTVLYNQGVGLSSGASCGLGKFYPISKDEAQALKEPPDIEPEPLPPADPEEPGVSE